MTQPRDPQRRQRPRRSARGDGGDPAPGRGGAAGPPVDEPLVIVRFKGQRKGYFHNRNDVELLVGRYCLVQADRGCDLGQVVYYGAGKPAWWQEAAQQGVLALAAPGDVARLSELRREERDAKGIARQRIAEHGLPMQLVGVERRWDRNKLTFYFLADGRVDFRALVRDLAGIFRTRIELRQIGVRDDARLKGGLGICGRGFCCATFLADFNSVGLRMAKDQQLPLNPPKLSGPCGRLRCCLAYEHAAYKELQQRMPRLGSLVVWGDRSGRVRKVDLLRGVVAVQLADDDPALVDVAVGELSFASAPPPEEGVGVGDGTRQAPVADTEPRLSRPRRRGRKRRPNAPPAKDREA